MSMGPVRPWWARLRDFVRPARLALREDQHDALAAALRTLGATVSERNWQVAGATERSVFDVTLGGRRARMISDSFEGPVLIGDAALISAIREEIDRAGQPERPRDLK